MYRDFCMPGKLSAKEFWESDQMDGDDSDLSEVRPKAVEKIKKPHRFLPRLKHDFEFVGRCML